MPAQHALVVAVTMTYFTSGHVMETDVSTEASEMALSTDEDDATDDDA